MGLRILVGVQGGDSNGRAALYCSTSMTMLLWIFESEEDAEAFVEEHGDVRRLGEKEQHVLFDAFYKAKRKREKKAEAAPARRSASRVKPRRRA